MKGKLSTLGFVLSLSALILCGCGRATAQPDVIQGSGNMVGEDRRVSNFNQVTLTGSGEMQVLITPREEESLIVEAEDNLMRYIKTEVKNETLILGFTDEVKNKSIRPTEDIWFYLTVKEVTGLDLSGAGDIYAPILNTDRLEVTVSGSGGFWVDALMAEELVVLLSGSGDFGLAGQVMKQDVQISGSGHYDAGELESQTAIVEVSGPGNATVWAIASLDVQISGSGNVEYYGSPSVSQEISGVGKLTSLGSPRQ